MRDTTRDSLLVQSGFDILTSDDPAYDEPTGSLNVLGQPDLYWTPRRRLQATYDLIMNWLSTHKTRTFNRCAAATGATRTQYDLCLADLNMGHFRSAPQNPLPAGGFNDWDCLDSGDVPASYGYYYDPISHTITAAISEEGMALRHALVVAGICIVGDVTTDSFVVDRLPC